MKELLKLSAFEIAALIAQKNASPREVLDAHIEQIEKVNPTLNAMVEKDFDRARLLADQQTERLAHSSHYLPPLFGVPFTVKEMFAYDGMKRTGGYIHSKDDLMDWDSTVVARFKKAGAIPMGTTNVPELGFWFETYNTIYGRTNNPYDISRTCGGSSGGEGALLGAGATPIGLGSDIGGSIRIPAFFCGVFGHKPSRFLVPFTGHYPYAKEQILKMKGVKYPFTSLGPMTRKARDLYPILKILMGADEFDQETLKDPRLEPLTTAWHGRKVLICPSPIFHGARTTDDELAQVVRNCGKLFSELGAEVEEMDPRFFVQGTDLWFKALESSRHSSLYESLVGPTEDFSLPLEILKSIMGHSHHTLPNLLVSLNELAHKDQKIDYKDELKNLQYMKATLDEKIGDNGILILPPHPRVAPKHKATYLSPFDFIYAGFFTTMGLPSTVAPTGLNKDGLPLGVQIVARHMKDHLTLSCAEFLEMTFGGWQPPEIASH